MNTEATYTMAKLYTANGDINKDWYAYYFVRNPSTGRLQMFKKRSKMNYIKSVKKRLAYGNDLITEINKLLKAGWSPFGNSVNALTLKEVVEQMYAIKKPSLRPRSVQSYKYCKDHLFEWMEKKNHSFMYPEQFDIKMCHSFCDWLITEKNLRSGNFNNHKTLIGSLFNMMEDREIIIKNPFRKIKSFPKTHGTNTPFTDEIKQALIDEMILKDYRLYLFTQYIYYCFIRPAELVRLRVGDVDLKNKKITLSKEQTKNKKPGTVVIPDAFIPIVESMNLHEYDKSLFIFGRTPGKNDSLTCAPVSISRNLVTARFLKLRRGLNLGSEITLYGWKDSGTCNAYKLGIPIYKIMTQCRHSSIAQTEIYLKSLGLEANVEFATKMK